MYSKNKVITSNLLLILAAAIWGSCFIFQKTIANVIGAVSFMAARYITGAIAMIPIILFMEHQRRDSLRAEGITDYSYGKAYFRKLLIAAPLCSIANIAGNILVQIGLAYTAASKAGFLNSIYIIFVPIVGYIVFRRKSSKFIFAGIIMAVIGLYNLCLTDTLSFEKGDIIILSSTILFALHIQLIAKYIREVVGIHFTFVEFLFGGAACMVVALFAEEPTLAQFITCAPNILYTGVLGVGLCYALQVTAQKYTDPTVASLLMSLEAVFSAIFGVLFLHESFTPRELIGIVFIIAAIIVSQLPSKKQH